MITESRKPPKRKFKQVPREVKLAKQFVQNLREYEYEGYKIYIPEGMRIFNVNIDFSIKFEFNDTLPVEKIFIAQDKIKSITNKALNNFLRYLLHVSKYYAKQKEITSTFKYLPPIKFNEGRNEIYVSDGGELDFHKFKNMPWKDFKKIIDKLFFIITQIANFLKNMPEITSVTVVDRNSNISYPQLESVVAPEILATEKIDEKKRKADILVNKIQNYNYKGEIFNGEILKPYVYTPSSSAEYVIQLATSILASVFIYDRDCNEECIIRILEKANQNINRWVDHYIPDVRMLSPIDYRGSLPRSSENDEGLWEHIVGTVIILNITTHDDWNILKKLFDKIFFVGNQVLKELDSKSEAGLPPIQVFPIEKAH